jgi:hypothetical protein
VCDRYDSHKPISLSNQKLRSFWTSSFFILAVALNRVLFASLDESKAVDRMNHFGLCPKFMCIWVSLLCFLNVLSVGTKTVTSQPCQIDNSRCSTLPFDNTGFHFKPVSAREVEAALNTLRVTGATGSDNISSRMLRLSSKGISTTIATIFNTVTTAAQFPTTWKIALVTPGISGLRIVSSEMIVNYLLLPCSLIFSNARFA